VDAVLADIRALTSVRRHQRVMAAEQPWGNSKIGTGAPPVRLPYGWVMPYHGVSTASGHPRYCMGIAILDLENPARILYRTPLPVLEPQTEYECHGLSSDIVFPSASDLASRRAPGHLLRRGRSLHCGGTHNIAERAAGALNGNVKLFAPLLSHEIQQNCSILSSRSPAGGSRGS